MVADFLISDSYPSLGKLYIYFLALVYVCRRRFKIGKNSHAMWVISRSCCSNFADCIELKIVVPEDRLNVFAYVNSLTHILKDKLKEVRIYIMCMLDAH